ncbi:RluA family pseudouridine synthase [Limosilactobacillus viscerum]|uniref:RluA family pseudouridine synthase n=1 Tax=Limosilactobacillus viscerum TaxID=2993450 RepID=UPI0024BA38E3|nr:RluA family pseudouridine synthase [Limosilactobacillus viscerum]
MEKIRWKIEEQLTAGQAPRSVRSLLHDQWLLPDRYIHFLRRRHHVLVNGQYRYMNERVAPGDVITMTFNGDEFRAPAANDYVPTVMPQLAVLYENRDLLVINKPQGEKSHPNEAGETGTVMNDVEGYLQGTNDGAYMVHRLDQETSGAMVVAKNPVVVPVLNRLISDGMIHREYLAVVSGQMQGRGVLDWPIGKDPDDKRKYCVAGRGAKPARTDYQVVATSPERSVVRLRLETGRTHQIRVHLAHSGHPIIGDPLYNCDGGSQMLLHGITQRLLLPFSFEKIVIQAPLPPYFHNYLVKYDLG